MEKKYYIFTSETCGKCQIIKKYLETNLLLDKVLLVNTSIPEGNKMAVTYSIRSLPTLLMIDNEDQRTFISGDVYGIIDILSKLSEKREGNVQT